MNRMMLPEHLLYVVFALSVSSKNNLDSFLTSFFVINLNFLSVQIILLLNMHWVIRQELCLAARPGFAHTPKPHRFKVQSPVGSRFIHLCTCKECFAEKLLCLSPLRGMGAVGPPRPLLSAISTGAWGTPQPFSTPPASAKQEVFGIKLQMQTN